jgi:hypothetical protein
MRNGLPTFFKVFQVKLNRFSNKSQNFLFRVRGSHAAREVRHIRSEGSQALLNHDQVTHSLYSVFFKPACLSTLFRVPGGISTLSLPATVTVPGFTG